MRRVILLVIIITLPVILSGCRAGRGVTYSADPLNAVRTVAVLPMYNVTNHVEGPEMVRKLVNEFLTSKHYAVMPIDEVDTILRDRMGITLGTQLEMTTPEALAAELKVDALLYGYLLDFDDVIFGLYNSRAVRVGFRLVDAVSGSVIWSGGKGVKTVVVSGNNTGLAIGAGKELLDEAGGRTEIFDVIDVLDGVPGLTDWEIVPLAIGDAKETAVFVIGAKVIGKALGIHLKYESDLAVSGALDEMPSGPGG
ncbi:MAG: hypothetical protein GY771_04235 [bacterium]|nr:hypothetical protein [bacterium]